ncbi:hypothetical protein NE236_31680 [Actinoallomurus purpureus]|uniref:hypothetical protein n=1 Tax=Actinoallomurus purpureus TaxID=478114 RepID=UPI0020926626|nr:hypothetical protein [Actinoallomurus purpureus]MCO6009542.1 hypothetical protein [Actinoallomurus purpureus]
MFGLAPVDASVRESSEALKFAQGECVTIAQIVDQRGYQQGGPDGVPDGAVRLAVGSRMDASAMRVARLSEVDGLLVVIKPCGGGEPVP